MEISIALPDEVGQRLNSRWRDFPRHALEALLFDAYRPDVLTAAEQHDILGLPSRFDVGAFVKQAGAVPSVTYFGHPALRRRRAGHLAVRREAGHRRAGAR